MLPSLLARSLPTSFLKSVYRAARAQASLEHRIEQSNAANRVSGNSDKSSALAQRLIVLPLEDSFIPSRINAMYGKVQYSDKCCFPASIGAELTGKPYDFPWIFEVTPVEQRGSTVPVPTKKKRGRKSPSSSQDQEAQDQPPNRAYVSTLDFRSPENYIFVPKWLMDNLKLQKYDLVDVRFIRMKLASSVTLQPRSRNWLSFVEKHGASVSTILENEINKYSTVTAGSTIAIKYDNEVYPLYVLKTISEDDISVWGVCIQDSDVRIEIDNSALRNKN
jgi:hypothetical protein